ncbi:hypothetical protein HY995_05985 [Candidatus Micrarchaeota archaeon]|nr:hypothetical protein [Candidatus Micrarchaeota archaeon]
MARDSGMCACGMHACGKCAPMIAVFGLLFLVAGLGLFTAPWFNGWTVAGVFMALWGGLSLMKG